MILSECYMKKAKASEFYMQLNAFLASVYMLWSGILFPLTFENNYHIISMGKYLLFFAVLIINYRRFINYNVFSFIVVYLLVICVKCISSYGSILIFSTQWEGWISLILNGIAILIVFSVPFKLHDFMKYSTRISMLACLVMTGCILDSEMFSFVISHRGWYMTFGFLLMVPLNVLLVNFSIYGVKRRKMEFCVYLLALVCLVMYGNRGAMLIHFILLFVLIYRKLKLDYLRYFILMTLFWGGMYLKNVLEYLSILLVENGYSNNDSILMIKLIKFYNNADMSQFASGRLEIWKYAWDSFLDNVMFGNDIGFIYSMSTSCHNIFLEILSTYGIFVFLFFIIYIMYHLLCSWYFANGYNKVCICLFVSFAFPSFTSGGIFLETGFMSMLGVLLSQKSFAYREKIPFEECRMC